MPPETLQRRGEGAASMSEFTSPTSIGHYMVERELGRGAMGVVFLASDTRLGRKVAIKALPIELALDPMRQMKFDREARTLAAVNHPNIGAIFGIEEAQGARYLVLELVEGETLAEHIAYAPPSDESGGMPALGVAETLDICGQVAAGMAAAHAQGIIHRDLKPANVKIRPDGLVKVLDFGIARGGPVETTIHPSRATEAPTLVGPSDAATTHVGTIIWTPGYMSPEQARGRPVGKATDLWSFACMMYECLTGRLAFPGETLADALAATLTTEPDYAWLPARTPARIVELMRRCLEKDQQRRLSDFGEAEAELDRAARELAGGGGAVGAPAGTVVLEPAPADELEGWPSASGNLPGDDTSFVDRAAELGELSRLLLASRHLSIIGPSGIGKTRLALQAARGVEAGFACGAWYVEAAPVADASYVPLRLAQLLGASSGPEEPATATAARLIGRRRVMVVIDSCQLGPRAVAEMAGELLDACPRMTVVTIGHEALGVRDEKLYRVPAMETGARDGATELLRERARVAKATLDATPESVQAMIGLCGKLQGIPLPIELAAAWAESALFEDVGARLESHLQATGVASLETQAPEQVVRILVDWAFHQLTEGERGMLRRLSVFAGGCTLRAAAAISGAGDSFPDPRSPDSASRPVTQAEARVRDVLSRLASLSLLTVRRSVDGSAISTRFLLHEAVRRFARERLLEFAGSSAVLNRHMLYFVALAEQGMARLDGADAEVWRARLSAELANLFAAVESAESLDDPSSAERLRECIERLRGDSRGS